MTREEAIAELNTFKIGAKSELGENALDMAIKALNQDPCEDAVSRKAVKEALRNRIGESISDCINALPSVTPTHVETVTEFADRCIECGNRFGRLLKRKKGKWVNKSHTSDCGIKFVASECTCCGKKTFFDCDQLVYNYCPNCGAEMEGEEESK